MKIGLTIICMVSLLALAGCWDRTEINDLAIVTAAAIDNMEGDQIELSIQIIIPKNMGTSPGGESGADGGQMTLVKSAAGVNIADAISKLQSKVSRRIFWGHCKVYVFGEEMAKRGILPEVDFLVRHPQPRERAYLFVSKGRASEILELHPPLERSSAEVIRELSNLHIGMLVTVVDLKEMLRGDSRAAALPMLDKQARHTGEEKLQITPYIFGTAIFKNGKMIGLARERSTRGILWLRGEVQRYTITVKAPDAPGYISLNPIRSEVKLIPSIENGVWKMTIKARTEGDIVQNGSNLDMMVPEFVDKVQAAVREDIRNRMMLALDEVQKGMKADIFGFAKEFHRKYPEQWKQVKERWDEVFPQVQVKMEVQAYIRRPGLVTVPGGIPDEEVKDR